jgi:hypothetical protein
VKIKFLFLSLACFVTPALAQMGSMPGMGHPAEPPSLIGVLEHHATPGTDAQPASTPSEMLMKNWHGWMWMLHGEAFLQDVQQSGPRGADKLFSTNWIMPMAQHKFGNGTLTFKAMLSLEPATIPRERYPELFQQGETAYGKPIVDGQHPHDFFSELAMAYDYRVNDSTLLSFYAAPMGDPAMGPVAYPHRTSASEDPIAPLSHHLQDSTHVADDVITVGIAHRSFRLEASGFHGREPDEYRWNIDSGAMDSWSARATVNPAANWSLQYSIAQLHSPESLAPSDEVRRMSASVAYNHPISDGNWASLLVWGRNQSLEERNIGNGYLLESTLNFRQSNYVWTRIENADRTNELLGENPEPPGFQERYFARVQAYSVGYDRELGHIPHLSTALGGQVTWYGVPDILKAAYGTRPLGVVLFLRLRAH